MAAALPFVRRPARPPAPPAAADLVVKLPGRYRLEALADRDVAGWLARHDDGEVLRLGDVNLAVVPECFYPLPPAAAEIIAAMS